MNDSYLTGTHLNDMTVFGPIFHEDELVGFAASRALARRRRERTPAAR